MILRLDHQHAGRQRVVVAAVGIQRHRAHPVEPLGVALGGPVRHDGAAAALHDVEQQRPAVSPTCKQMCSRTRSMRSSCDGQRGRHDPKPGRSRSVSRRFGVSRTVKPSPSMPLAIAAKTSFPRSRAPERSDVR